MSACYLRHRPEFEDITHSLKHVLTKHSITGCAKALKETLAPQDVYMFRGLPNQGSKIHSHLIYIEVAAHRHFNRNIDRLNLVKYAVLQIMSLLHVIFTL